MMAAGFETMAKLQSFCSTAIFHHRVTEAPSRVNFRFWSLDFRFSDQAQRRPRSKGRPTPESRAFLTTKTRRTQSQSIDGRRRRLRCRRSESVSVHSVVNIGAWARCELRDFVSSWLNGLDPNHSSGLNTEAIRGDPRSELPIPAFFTTEVPRHRAEPITGVGSQSPCVFNHEGTKSQSSHGHRRRRGSGSTDDQDIFHHRDTEPPSRSNSSVGSKPRIF